MTSHRIRPFALLLTLAPLAACYVAHDAIIPTDDSGSEDAGSESGSTAPTTTAGDPTTASDTSLDTTASTTMSTSAADDTGPTDTGDSTADGSTTDTGPICGDAMIEGDEVCDDGVNDGSYGGCLPDCTNLGPHCGDGVEQGDEACDDGDEVNGNGCNVDCIVSGTVLWTQTFEGAAQEDDGVEGVAVTPDDEIVVTGTEGLSGTTYRAWTREYDPDGSEIWTVTYNGASGTRGQGHGVAIDGDGNVYVAGQYDSPSRAFVRVYDENGNVSHTHTYVNAANDAQIYNAIDVTDDGYSVAAGVESANDVSSVHVWLQRLDPSADELWSRTYDDGVASSYANAVAIDGSGNIIVAGSTPDGGGTQDVWLRKYDQEGAALWSRVVDPGGYDAAHGVAADSDGSIVVVGGGDSLGWVRKYDEDGAEQWTEQWTAGNTDLFSADIARAVAIDHASDVVVGATLVGGDGNLEAAVRKYSSDGDPRWTLEWTDIQGTGNPSATSVAGVAIDSGDNVVVGGFETVDGNRNAWVRKVTP